MTAILRLGNYVRFAKRVKVFEEDNLIRLLSKLSDSELIEIGSTLRIRYDDSKPPIVVDSHYLFKDENNVSVFVREFYETFMLEILSNIITQHILEANSKPAKRKQSFISMLFSLC